VIDTGFDFNGKWTLQPKLCATGHKDFTGTGLQDNHGHGTHIAGLIAKYAAGADYCIVILKFYDPSQKDGDIRNSTAAMNYAVDQKVDVINFSGGGMGWNHKERMATVRALNAKITVIVAAGNERSNLKDKPYYPALYDGRTVVVGAIDANSNRIPASNYGPQVDVYEQGRNVYSILPSNSYGYMTGTSQATAIHTGKTVNKMYKFKKLYDEYKPKFLKRLVANVAQ
jgi:subtilisin family serine protease